MKGTIYDPLIGSCPWLWMLLFGPFYLIYKGLFGHAILWFIALVIFPIAILIYPFVIRGLIFKNLVYKGVIKQV